MTDALLPIFWSHLLVDNARNLNYNFFLMAGKKVLIVDYDAKHIESLVQLFKPYNFQMIEASDGLSAYEKFKSEKPDLVILEAIIPKLHGFDLTKKISQESGGKTPVIVVTGLYKGPQFRHEAINSFGASDYFEKPLDRKKFVPRVLSLLNEREIMEETLPDPEAVVKNLASRIKS